MFLDAKSFLIHKIKKGNLLKYTWNYEIYDPETNEKIADVKNELKGILKILGPKIRKNFAPKTIGIYSIKDGTKALTIKMSPQSAKISVFDSAEKLIARMDSKFLSGSYYTVYDADGTTIGRINGSVMSREFLLKGPHDNELGMITKSLQNSCGNDCCRAATDFAVVLTDNAGFNAQAVKASLLAAGLAMDMVLTR